MGEREKESPCTVFFPLCVKDRPPTTGRPVFYAVCPVYCIFRKTSQGILL